jgi:uncharacterized protein YwgA
MRREDLTLIMLALSDGRQYTPVQIQKAMFLADDFAREAFDSRYDFQPYDYGPFDPDVYRDVERMEVEGLTRISVTSRGWNVYMATDAGRRRGRELLDTLPPEQRDKLTRISKFVRTLSFTDLVSSIYKAYPHMRERSVFRD